MGAALVVAAALAGCATGPREITSSVQSYANMGGIHLPATYRMELLPSQTHQQSFARIEAAAQDALQRVGLTRDPRPDLARLVVQIGASADRAMPTTLDMTTGSTGHALAGGWVWALAALAGAWA